MNRGDFRSLYLPLPGSSHFSRAMYEEDPGDEVGLGSAVLYRTHGEYFILHGYFYPFIIFQDWAASRSARSLPRSRSLCRSAWETILHVVTNNLLGQQYYIIPLSFAEAFAGYDYD
jgi:hypothetical protein